MAGYNNMANYWPHDHLARDAWEKGKISLKERLLFEEHCIQFCTTNKCNLNCDKCSRGCDDKAIPKFEYTFKEFKRDFEAIWAKKFFHSVSLAGGENHLCGDFQKIFKWCVEREDIYRVHIITNGLHIPDDPGEIALMQNLKVIVSLTPYKGTKWQKFVDFCVRHQINLHNNQEQYPYPMDTAEKDIWFDVKIADDLRPTMWYRHCFTCPVCVPGRLYQGDCCIRFPELMGDDYLDLCQPFTLADIFNLVREPMKMCHHCQIEVTHR